MHWSIIYNPASFVRLIIFRIKLLYALVYSQLKCTFIASC